MDGKRLKSLRKEIGLTQKELAKELHLSYHAISGYERNKSEPSDEIKKNIARYFHVSADYLLGLSDLRNNNFEGESEIISKMKELTEADRKSIQLILNIIIARYKEGYKKK